jgi:MFS transporter, ACS family, aldohexuronate transporter
VVVFDFLWTHQKREAYQGRVHLQEIADLSTYTGAIRQPAPKPPGDALHQDSRFAWMLVSVLFAGSLINYMDRALLGFLMPQVRQSLSLTNTDYSLVVNSFLFTYMIFYVIGGRIADKLGYTRAFLVNVVVWCIASVLHAFSQGMLSLCVLRALLGVGEGGFFPTAMRGVARWFSPESRVKAVAVVLTGTGIGMLITPPIAAWLSLHYGWRTSFFATGAVGFALLPAWLFLHRQVKANLDQDRGRLEPDTTRDPSLFEVLRQRKYACLLMARALTDAAWFFYLFWLPGYFQEIRGFSLAMVGTLLWIPYLSADIGSLAGAWASSGLIARGFSLNRSRKAVLIGSALLCLCGPASYYASRPSATLALLSIAFFGQFAWGSNLHTAITEVTPTQYLGVLYGLAGAAGTLAGTLSQPLVGRLVDSTGYEPAFLAAGATFIIAIVLLLSAGKIEYVQLRAL